ncbi:MAG: hypothetical protein ACXACP_13595 [Candidatus Hodarchaeales archaeon]|jgi:hypothetical protein
MNNEAIHTIQKLEQLIDELEHKVEELEDKILYAKDYLDYYVDEEVLEEAFQDSDIKRVDEELYES